MHPAWNWFSRAKKESEYSRLDPVEVAAELGAPVEDVKTAIEFMSVNTEQRIEIFKFLIEQILA